MHQRRRVVAAGAATIAIFLAVQVGALALVGPFESAGYRAVENPSNPANSAIYLGAILVATAVMLGTIKLGADWVLRGFVILSAGFVSLYVFSVLLPAPLGWSVAGIATSPLALAAAGLLAGALLFYPEWYVIDAAGIVMGAGAAALFGISFGLLPAIVLLVALAVYDAISVYGTEHMLALADGVMDLKLPVVLVIPLTLSYSFLDESPSTAEDSDGRAVEADGGEPSETRLASSDERGEVRPEGAPRNSERQGRERSESDGGDDAATDETADANSDGDDAAERPGLDEREALFVGLGDAVMPGVMVASAAVFAPASPLVTGFALTLPALTAMIGTICGLVALLWFVMQGRAHAGLPLLNGGAVGGYLLGALAAGIPLVRAVGLGPYV
ncbi:presenilin family intramembrane aspartyl protease PSH [Halococcus agarilyticus]|uniref:presenilin family intramembrane aspartyl protease PSH n=1 Tax=Halococcus agarilyticus TaxID=1232219 RepID=UPI000677CDC9|nr:presenilin family intramembrane aspartyl protease PSH [Halococcus agarilyticus]